VTARCAAFFHLYWKPQRPEQRGAPLTDQSFVQLAAAIDTLNN
jgi:hypothetical protein